MSAPSRAVGVGPSSRFDVEALIALGRVTSAVPHPSGSWLAVAVSRLDSERAKYVSEIWRVAIDPGLEPVKLTRGASDDRAPAFRSDGALAFLSNRNPRVGKPEEGDEERAQVWVFPPSGMGEPMPVTDEPLGVDAFHFASKGDALVVVAPVLPGVPHEAQRARARELAKKGPTALTYTRMPVRFWDRWLGPAVPRLIAYDARGGNRRDLLPEWLIEEPEVSWDVSPDGARVVVTQKRIGADRIHESALLVIELATGARRELGAEPRVELSDPRFSPDGRRGVCVRHDRKGTGHGRPALWLIDVETGAQRALAPDWDVWPVPHGFTHDGARVVVTADHRGCVPVFTVGVESGGVTRITSEESGGSHERLFVLPGARDAVVGLRHRTVHPPAPFRVELRANEAPVVLADLAGFDDARGRALARVTEHTARASDGLLLQYFVVAPNPPRDDAKGDAAQRHPTLLWIHGGPMSAWADGWHFRWNPLVAASEGYTVVLPNPRGSTGFGQEFLEGVWGNRWGEQCYRDVMSVVDAIAEHPACDAERIAAMGGSFGGYMANWIGGQTGRFRCLVTHASVFAMQQFHGTTDVPSYFSWSLGGAAPYGDTELHDRYSPHVHLAKWATFKTPTLVIHGERDYRVPVSEGLGLFEALQQRGIASELLLFPDEGHWIVRPQNTVIWYRTVFEFLARYV